MMTSWHGNDYHITVPLWGESTGDRWIPFIKAGNVDLWWFLCCQPEQAFEQSVDLSMIWDAMTPMWRHCNVCDGTPVDYGGERLEKQLKLNKTCLIALEGGGGGGGGGAFFHNSLLLVQYTPRLYHLKGLSRYRHCLCKAETAKRPPHLYDENFYTGKTTALYRCWSVLSLLLILILNLAILITIYNTNYKRGHLL